MSKSKQDRILAMYYIMVNCGAKVSDSFRKLVESIQNQRMAERVARA